MSYPAPCASCNQRFDALLAPWCTCLVKERSVVCPSCGKCFCDAPVRYKQAFWMHAPAAMWARKKEENAHENAFVNPSRFDVKRPMVLVVDDDKQIQQVAIGVILGRGYGVVVANNGEEGFELAREYRPELILTDALMPKLDGREMTRQLKDDWLTSSSRVVIMTSLYTGGRYKYEAMKQFGADDYVAKPLSTEKLSEILKKHLG